MIPTEPIGSIPRPIDLIDAVAKNGGHADDPALEPLFDAAVRDTILCFQRTGSPVVTDGEQRKYPNFWDYCVHGQPNIAKGGFKIPFAAGHTRRMPRLAAGPFRYKTYADQYLEAAQRYASVKVKQAVLSPSALSLLYPADGVPAYDSTHSADVDYAELLPSLLQLNLTNYYVALAGEPDRRRVLGLLRQHLRPGQRIFVGVVAPIDPRIETAEEVRDRVLEAAEYIPLDQLETTDDCGFSPFSDDRSTTRGTAFAKIAARVRGTPLAEQVLRVDA